MRKQMVSTHTTFADEQPVPYQARATPNEEAGSPRPVGAVCRKCFSTDLVQSRRPGLFAIAKLFGYKVYRCRQCMKRTVW
jgi:ribosomal protein L40E